MTHDLIVRCAAIMLSTLAAVTAQDAFDLQVPVKIWGDPPSAAVQEINAHLPPHLRLSWFVDKALDESLDQAPMLEAQHQSVRQVLDAYCQQAGLAWSGTTRGVWIWKPVPAEHIASWSSSLGSGSAADRAAALHRLVQAATPDALGAVLTAYFTGDAEAQALARSALRGLVGISPGSPAGSLAEAFDAFGDLDRSKHRIAYPGTHSSKLPAPWVALACVLADPTQRTRLEQRIAAQEKPATDLTLLSIAVAGRVEAIRPALELWKTPAETGHGGWTKSGSWEPKGIAARAGSLLAWAWGPAEAAHDHEAAAKKFREELLGGNPDEIATLNRQIQDLDRQLGELRHDKKTHAARIKELEGQRRAAEARIGAINKAVENRLKIVDGFDGYGPASAAVLAELVSDTSADPLLRQKAAVKLQRLREPAVVPALIHVCREDQEPRVRQDVALALGASRETTAIAALHQDLDQAASPVARLNAVRGLILSGHPEAGAWVLKRLLALPATESEQRQTLLHYLGLFRSQAALDHLIATAQGTGEIGDRLSATAGLSRSTTRRARETLAILLADATQPEQLRTLAVDAFIPKVVSEIDRCHPVLSQTITGTRSEALSKKLIEGLQHCARLMSPADPRHNAIAHQAIALIQDPALPSNARQIALNTFKYTTNDAAIVDALRSLHAGTKDPIMKAFISKALSQAEASLSAPK